MYLAATAKNEEDDERSRDEERTVEERVADEVAKTGSVTTENPGGAVHCLTIVGQIEGHNVLPSSSKTTKYEHVIPQLAAIEESPDIRGLLIILNTVGGDVEAGLAIAEMISSMEKPTVSLVLGGGHSIGVPLAVASKRSFIVPSATMTIHPVRFNGMVIGVPQTFAYFMKMQERIVHFVTSNSRMDEALFRKLMLETDELASDMGTVIDGAEAVEMGLIDELGGLSHALRALHAQIDG
ncbi:MAG: ATP-dependent Clp protease proteolytic subunit [Clostridiaceae bacterium]|nr:ATP-dependent Clp protease proteolytic subunit [Clostridiaceae bacterium]